MQGYVKKPFVFLVLKIEMYAIGHGWKCSKTKIIQDELDDYFEKYVQKQDLTKI